MQELASAAEAAKGVIGAASNKITTLGGSLEAANARVTEPKQLLEVANSRVTNLKGPLATANTEKQNLQSTLSNVITRCMARVSQVRALVDQEWALVHKMSVKKQQIVQLQESLIATNQAAFQSLPLYRPVYTPSPAINRDLSQYKASLGHGTTPQYQTTPQAGSNDRELAR
jgi:chromosome segregation ATPase